MRAWDRLQGEAVIETALSDPGTLIETAVCETVRL